MKFFVGLLLAVAVCSTVGLPARDPNTDTEYINPSQDDFSHFSGVIDTGADFPAPVDPFGVQTGGIFNSFSDIMRRFRERVFGNWWNNIPTLDIGELEPSKENSTSVIKVIDGHRVEINNTVYTKVSEDGSSVYKVRVVNVRPLDEDTIAATNIPTFHDSTDAKPVDSNQTPESVKDREELDNEVGHFDASESTTTQLHESSTTTPSEIEQEAIEATTTPKPSESREEVETADALEAPENSDAEWGQRFEKLELKDELPSKSVSSEEMTGNIRAAYNPSLHSQETRYRQEFSEEDPEIDYSHPTQSGYRHTEWDSYEDWHTNRENNNIDDFQSVPVDLSNDIEVNNMLADQGAPTNPDAEVFAVPPQNTYHPHPSLYFQSIPSSYSWYSAPTSRVWPKRK